ncbi:NUDIX domain-containing protein [Kosakonia cowanii]|jgi:nudix-type nucleoside diphosphatase (YffH/AdpP family)|uniref:NUDIX domain-containing protein n=1 Tax=Kosakonia cowanii TaxID=208223 RepID=UPI0027319A8D|nr:NUDIX domain-containing protein [Kosakonia cowanii]WKW44029.1 NUDIX domain-containing protein [Kosakonia cowanii]
MQREQAQARIIKAIPLSQDWGKLTKYTFDFRRRNGEWQRQSREVYDRGNGATILLYNRSKRSVILTRQFRLPLFVNNHAGFLLEAAAGLLDELDAETRIKQEAEEETGYRLERVEKVFEAWMSPGSVSEKLHFFIAEYDESRRTGNGGGLIEEGEDIEVVEMTFTDALAAIRSGEIADGKTIMLLQHLALEGVL